MDKLNSPIFFRLSKVDVAQRTVEGIATAELPDKANEVCDYESTKPYYEKWSDGVKKATDGKSLGNVRAMHAHIAAGKVVDLQFDDIKKSIHIVAKIVDDAEWNKVVEGVYSGFSQGGQYVRKWKDGTVTRYTANPSEVSIVDSPCLPESVFECVKADGTSEMRKFHVAPADPEKKVPEQVWKTTDGTTFSKKQDAEIHQGTIDAEEFAQQCIGRVTKIANEIEAEIEKREFSDEERKKLAESGHAMEDGSFPISNEQDLKNAIRAIGRAKDPEKAKEHIKTRAKDMGLESVLPDDWKVAKVDAEPVKNAATVKKEIDDTPDGSIEKVLGEMVVKKAGLHADHVHSVMAIHKSANAIMEHVHKAMHGVEVHKDEHHTEEDQQNVEMAHLHAAHIADKCMKMTHADAPKLSDEHAGHVHEMHKCATNVMDGAQKFLHGDGVSKESHHNAHDRSQLHKMHANAHEIADKCIKMFGEGEEDHEKVTKLAKAMEERDTLLLKATAERDALVKAVGDLAPKFEEMQKRIDHLEKQPAPRKGALYAVDQGRHELESGDGAVETIAKVNIRALRLSPEEERSLQLTN